PPRRVLVLYPHDDVVGGQSGASRRVNLLIEFLVSRGMTVRVVECGEHPPATLDGVEVESLGHLPTTGWGSFLAVTKAAILSLGRGMTYRWFFLQYGLIRHYHDRRRRVHQLVRWSDVVMLEYPFWADPVVQIAHREGRRVILTSYDILAEQIKGLPILKAAAWRQELRALKSADVAVAVSTDDRDMMKQAGLSPVLSPNPTDGRLFEIDRLPTPRRVVTEVYGVDLPWRRICLFVGSRHEPNILAAADIRRVADTMASRPDGQDIGFVLVGACADPERDGNFLALGRVSNGLLLSLYAICDLVLVPIPFGTGSSLKTVEGMAAGKVLLGTAVGFRGLDIQSGREAIIEDDLTVYADHIIAILNNPARAATIGATARQFARAYDSRQAFLPYDALLGLPAQPVDANVQAIGALDPTLREMARDALQAGQRDIAVAIVDEVLRLAPDDAAARALLSDDIPIDPNGGDAGPQPDAWPQVREALWSALHDGRHQELIDRVRVLLRENDGVGDLHFLIAQGLHHSGQDRDAAIMHYTRALQLGFDPYWTLLGRALARRDRYETWPALCDTTRALLRRPFADDSRRRYVDILRLTYSLVRGSRRPKPSAAQLPPEVRRELWALFSAGQLDETIAHASPLLDEDTTGEFSFIVAQSLHNQGSDLTRALDLYNRALAAGFDPYWVLVGRSRLYRDLSRWPEALRDLTKALTYRPFDREARPLYRQLVRYAYRTIRPKQAAGPQDRELIAKRQAMWRLFEAGQFQEVVDAGRPLLQAANDGETCFLIAQSLHNGGIDVAESVPLYTQALGLDYNPYWVRMGRGRAYFELGQDLAAATDFMAATARRPLARESRLAIRLMASILLRRTGLRRPVSPSGSSSQSYPDRPG
ncbi:MAG: glycosyltransferase, partial [Acetobacteraceae bacterium]